ncbi:T9SS type A sorting domain-containing protein [uncultured Lutibacter sp.]|uniref:T9SS type A sorting domain-containing protein n=1 Tax=uncultured Lutibacter sp. TaxID=437739 RepID=UPI0026323330|nr:T9SS type A sorting domain-containing protein [uncultured Lutibacter sp.]
MKKKLLLILFSFILTANCFSQEIQRSTISVQGNSENISINKKNYVIQQSIGQSSVIGTFQSDRIALRQGFIQPPLISSEIILEETTIEAIIYPNPFESSINITFNENLKEQLSIFIFDMLGRVVYQNNREASQKININLSNLASAQYILNITSGNKKFKANLVKR